MLHPFFGGVHPLGHKAMTEHMEAVPLPEAPAQVILPLSTHVGEPCVPVVSEGEPVKVGQPVGEPRGLGAPIHASVSGRVAAVEPRSWGGGGRVLSVVLDNDFQDTPMPGKKRRGDPLGLSGAEILERIRDSGVVGMGGAGFPTYHKLADGVGRVETLIINGAECEPYITSDHRLMLDDGGAVVQGAKLMARALEAPDILIVVEDNKPDALENLRLLTKGESGIRVRALGTQYPQGAERQLIQTLTGRRLPRGKLPVEAGCVVCNVATAAAVWEAVAEDRALTRRRVTLTGEALAHPGNWIVPIGTPVSWLIEQAGGFQAQPDRVLLGGPMTGTALYDLDVPVMKTTNCVLCLTGEETRRSDPAQSCIRCGKCVEVCPMKLPPLFLWENARLGRWGETEALHVEDCIECGCCGYICPARLPLVQSFRTAKAALQTERAGGQGKEADDR